MKHLRASKPTPERISGRSLPARRPAGAVLGGLLIFCGLGTAFTVFVSPTVTACQNGGAEKGAGTAPRAPEAERESSRFPWNTGETFRYVWDFERRRVGTTEFSIEDLERDRERNPVPAARYRIRSAFEYEREGTSRRSEVESFLDARWSLLRYRTRTRVHTVRDIRSNQESEGWIEGSKLLVDVTSNRDPANRVRSDLDLPEGARVIVPQAVEIWAVLIAGLPRGRDIPPQALAYPEFGKVYAVGFEFAGEEEVEPRGGEPVRCRRFRFRSEEGQLQGEVWIDGRGRMLRYEQGPLRVALELPAAASGEKEDAKKGAKGKDPAEKGTKE